MKKIKEFFNCLLFNMVDTIFFIGNSKDVLVRNGEKLLNMELELEYSKSKYHFYSSRIDKTKTNINNLRLFKTIKPISLGFLLLSITLIIILIKFKIDNYLYYCFPTFSLFSSGVAYAFLYYFNYEKSNRILKEYLSYLENKLNTSLTSVEETKKDSESENSASSQTETVIMDSESENKALSQTEKKHIVCAVETPGTLFSLLKTNGFIKSSKDKKMKGFSQKHFYYKNEKEYSLTTIGKSWASKNKDISILTKKFNTFIHEHFPPNNIPKSNKTSLEVIHFTNYIYCEIDREFGFYPKEEEIKVFLKLFFHNIKSNDKIYISDEERKVLESLKNKSFTKFK